jgi:hypothetical protein
MLLGLMAVIPIICLREALPALLDGSDADGPEEQSLEDLALGLDAAGLISYPEDTIVYGRIPFGLALSPRELLRR